MHDIWSSPELSGKMLGGQPLASSPVVEVRCRPGVPVRGGEDGD